MTISNDFLFVCCIADLIDNIVCYVMCVCFVLLQKIPLTLAWLLACLRVCVCVWVCLCVRVCVCVFKGGRTLALCFSFKYKLLVDAFCFALLMF